MATGPISAQQVGSYFVGQYYHVLQRQPEQVYQFYSDGSTMVRIDGDSSESAVTVLQIHNLIVSLNFKGIEIKSINALNSWTGGILVMVTGSVKIEDYHGARKFVQSFFLAPQEKGYFVLNDIFQFEEEELVHHDPASLVTESQIASHLDASTPIPQSPADFNNPAAVDYGLEEEAREYVNSLHVDDDPVDKYSLQEEQQQYDPEPETVVVETPAEVSTISHQDAVNIVQDHQAPAFEEPVGEAPKKTYASILQARAQYTPSVVSAPSYKSVPPTSEWDYTPAPQPTARQPPLESSYVMVSGTEATEEGSAVEDEGEVKSVYVRNLPSNVTSTDIEMEFKNFGQIKPGSIFIRSREEFGTCYAFVEFEDISSVQNAIQASPIQLSGKQVYIEERRANRTGATRGGRRGRGRGGYQSDAPRGRFGGRGLGRGSSAEGGDYSRARGNGYYQRGY